jgi:hypothetical protein
VHFKESVNRAIVFSNNLSIFDNDQSATLSATVQNYTFALSHFYVLTVDPQGARGVQCSRRGCETHPQNVPIINIVNITRGGVLR